MTDENKKQRPLMLICGACKHHDLDGYSLLEIDFNKGLMTYVCRECSHDNIIKLNSVPPSLPRIGVR